MIRRCPTCGSKNRIPAERLGDQPRCGSCKTTFSPLDAPVEVSSEQEFTDLVSRSPLPVLVDFWAPWCGPCRMVAPEVAQIARDEAGRVVVAKVDTDLLPQVAGRLGIKGVPTMVLYRQGREQQRISGAGSAASLTAQLGL